MADKAIRLLLSLTGGSGQVVAYSVKTQGYWHLVIAPINALAEIEAAVRQANTAREVAYLQSIDADTDDIRMARLSDPDFQLTHLEILRHETLIILPSALKALKPERPVRRKRTKKAAPVTRPKRVVSQATKDKISAAHKARRLKTSLLQAVASGGPDVPPPAQPD